MEDIQDQLVALRRQIAGINRKYTDASPAAVSRLERPRSAGFIQDLISGAVVSTPCGEHFETERFWERHRRHGSMDISDLAELPEDLLDPLSDGAIPRAHPVKWAFLDT